MRPKIISEYKWRTIAASCNCENPNVYVLVKTSKLKTKFFSFGKKETKYQLWCSGCEKSTRLFDSKTKAIESWGEMKTDHAPDGACETN